jgi:hypothetical protein
MHGIHNLPELSLSSARAFRRGVEVEFGSTSQVVDAVKQWDDAHELRTVFQAVKVESRPASNGEAPQL